MEAFEAGNRADGVYTLAPMGENVDMYCDMTTMGGGWTLLVTSADNLWTTDEVLLHGSVSLEADYSVLSYADTMKGADCLPTLQYMIEVARRARSWRPVVDSMWLVLV